MWNLAEIGFKKFAEKRWWFFDTNCLSHLIKQFKRKEFRKRVASLVRKKPIIILANQVQEITKDSNLVEGFEVVISTLNTHFLPDLSRLWWAELCNYWSCTEINRFYTFSHVPGLKEQMKREDFKLACDKFDKEIQESYVKKISKEIGKNIDERDLNIILIHTIINRYSEKWFGRSIPIDINPSSFKSFFIFSYTYYYRYLKSNQVKIETNDAIDFLNAFVSPYCERYYAEKKFTNIMKQYQGKYTPSAFELAKRAFKQGYLEEKKLQILKRNKERFNFKYKLLSGVQIYNYRDFRNHLDLQSITL